MFNSMISNWDSIISVSQSPYFDWASALVAVGGSLYIINKAVLRDKLHHSVEASRHQQEVLRQQQIEDAAERERDKIAKSLHEELGAVVSLNRILLERLAIESEIIRLEKAKQSLQFNANLSLTGIVGKHERIRGEELRSATQRLIIDAERQAVSHFGPMEGIGEKLIVSARDVQFAEIPDAYANMEAAEKQEAKRLSAVASKIDTVFTDRINFLKEKHEKGAAAIRQMQRLALYPG